MGSRDRGRKKNVDLRGGHCLEDQKEENKKKLYAMLVACCCKPLVL